MDANRKRVRMLVVFLILVVAGVAVVAVPTAPTAPETTGVSVPTTPVVAAVERGQMLYENHCGGCHTSTVHIRTHRKADSLEAVRWEVTRWSRELQLDWRKQDVSDVVEYLDHDFYKLAVPEAPQPHSEPGQ